MISYSTNMMGPWTNKWYEDNGVPYSTVVQYSKILDKEITIKRFSKQYCGGRIDVRGIPDEPYGLEYGLPIMEGESWQALSDWLWGFESDDVLGRDELLKKFEGETGHKIKWFKGEP